METVANMPKRIQSEETEATRQQSCARQKTESNPQHTHSSQRERASGQAEDTPPTVDVIVCHSLSRSSLVYHPSGQVERLCECATRRLRPRRGARPERLVYDCCARRADVCQDESETVSERSMRRRQRRGTQKGAYQLCRRCGCRSN